MMIPLLQNPDRTNLLLDFAEHLVTDNWYCDPKILHSIRVQDDYFKANQEHCFSILLQAYFIQGVKTELDPVPAESQEGHPDPFTYRVIVVQDAIYLYSQHTPSYILDTKERSKIDKMIDNYLRLFNLLTNLGFYNIQIDHNVFKAKFRAQTKLQQPEKLFKSDVVKWHNQTKLTGHSINFEVNYHNSLPESMHILNPKATYMQRHNVVIKLELLLRSMLLTYKNTVNMPN